MDWPMGYDGADIQTWAESAASIYWWPLLGWAAGAVILFCLAVLITRFPVHRRFWCEQAGREVEVGFEEDGPPGLRRFIAVVSCTAFEPSTAVRCHRSCLDHDVSGLEVRRHHDRAAVRVLGLGGERAVREAEGDAGHERDHSTA